MIVFAEKWRTEIERRERRLKQLAKVDYKHQDEIDLRLNWCKIALDRLGAIRDGSEVHDLADIPAGSAELDSISSVIEANIRADQAERIGQYRNDGNAEEATALLAALDGLTIEAIEDRIAQLRDGRSAATFETKLDGLVGEFTPRFVTLTASPDWPRSTEAFRETLASSGPLFVEEDRRAAGLDLIGLYRDIAASLTLKQPLLPKVREFLEEIGFEGVKFHDVRQLGRTEAWHGAMTGIIRSDGWFLPPAFGSKATAGYRLLLTGPDVLPETILKGLSPETLAVLLRQELAERLRGGAIPALLIDEALVAFTAMRRDTRARTIFDCGLPYGRVERYSTDPGQIAEEMFFGRQEEIRQIMSQTADGCLVYGGRQLGKSALLSHIARTRHSPDDERIVVRREVKWLGNSEKTSEIWAHLASMLSRDGVVMPANRSADDVARQDSGNRHPRFKMTHYPDATVVAAAARGRASAGPNSDANGGYDLYTVCNLVTNQRIE